MDKRDKYRRYQVVLTGPNESGQLLTVARRFSAFKVAQGEDSWSLSTPVLTFSTQLNLWVRLFREYTRQSNAKELAGLAVQVTCYDIDQATIGKLSIFLSNPEHESIITRITGQVPTMEFKAGRGWQIQVNEGSKTIEFSLGEGPMTLHRIQIAVQFLESLLEFCRMGDFRFLSEDDYFMALKQQPGLRVLKERCKEAE